MYCVVVDPLAVDFECLDPVARAVRAVLDRSLPDGWRVEEFRELVDWGEHASGRVILRVPRALGAAARRQVEHVASEHGADCRVLWVMAVDAQLEPIVAQS